ncbi:hypothetical protein YpF1991016_1916 [Yersinia pestis biovar Orientalis str. F1991016]|nr:hypothetical protein YpF1991016_1916 [Yersinia pestis biovar Orientalis str. F1991016]
MVPRRQLTEPPLSLVVQPILDKYKKTPKIIIFECQLNEPRE